MKERLKFAQSSLAQLCVNRGNLFYPKFHLATPAAWQNDPNGLIYFGDRYHAFYQHNPFSEVWGPMHWGHATSNDMVHWQHEPIALAPGDDGDKDGCFSGSAVDDNGVLSLIYTGHNVTPTDSGDIVRQVQCLAISEDGIHFKKQGVVLTPPEGVSDFRDPKVWRENGSWWMVVGNRYNDLGRVLLYRGDSLQDWHFDRVLACTDGKNGTKRSYMWECPDFYKCGDHHYLMFSPQGMDAEGYDYRNLDQSGILQGTWQPGGDFSISGNFKELDHGHDFYAPQSFVAKDGRRIMMGWMDMWDSPMPSQNEGWAGCFTLPRELFERDGNLCQRPVGEMESLRQQEMAINYGTITAKQPLLDNADCVEMELFWNLTDSKAERYGLQLGKGLQLYVDNQAQRLVLWHSYPEDKIDGYRSIALPQGDQLHLRLFIDMSSLEVFVNDGDATLTSRIYPKAGERQLQLFASEGECVLTSGKLWLLD